MAQEHKVSVISKTQLTNKIWVLDVKLEEPSQMQFNAGQCVSFHVADKQKRLYSITNTPEVTDRLSFFVDVSPMGYGSKFVLDLKDNESFILDGPHGIFTVKDFERDLLFVSTGAGVAPFKGIVTDTLKKGFNKKLTLIFGVRNQDDAFAFDYFENLAKEYPNFEFIPTLSQPKEGWTGSVGRVTTLLEQSGDKYQGRLVYICGSLAMIKDTRAILVSKGFPMKDIKLENFG